MNRIGIDWMFYLAITSLVTDKAIWEYTLAIVGSYSYVQSILSELKN